MPSRKAKEGDGSGGEGSISPALAVLRNDGTVGQVVEVGRQVVVVLGLVQDRGGEWGWGLNLGLLGWQDGGVR